MQSKAMLKERAETLLREKKCWYVSDGVGTTFQLALGKKCLRAAPLLNKCQSAHFRKFEGEVNLLIWCAWRLETKTKILTSSDDAVASVAHNLRRIAGQVVTNVEVALPSWDIMLEFSNRLLLHVFCVHVPGTPSFDGNWYLTTPDTLYCAGPGASFTSEPRLEAS